MIFLICIAVFLKERELSKIIAPLGITKGEFFLNMSFLSYTDQTEIGLKTYPSMLG